MCSLIASLEVSINRGFLKKEKNRFGTSEVVGIGFSSVYSEWK